ncbi:helix-turn-helix transcriptional regulator [Azospirillum sp.]|uniref:helix-turn-helix domain-containing protein n=1 Tax=Azospirillum sp. TaxID=34012 RepID=UPI002D62FDC6|nr:helix-turn-helix transcriptional regulator [Azospirillum sp.]HYD32876.1 helix-turn-helix transcriptional regulator [Azospirillaceae bacterium]HYF89785.1 helix-turn-helix transcriptional regulator [Azospirillum sp.]
MDIRGQFGRILRELRSSKGLSQEELAHRADMSVPYLSDLERGRSAPSLSMLVDLARGLGVHPADLLKDLVLDDAPPSRKRPRD